MAIELRRAAVVVLRFFRPVRGLLAGQSGARAFRLDPARNQQTPAGDPWVWLPRFSANRPAGLNLTMDVFRGRRSEAPSDCGKFRLSQPHAAKRPAAGGIGGDSQELPSSGNAGFPSFPRVRLRPEPDGKWLAYQSNESGRFEIYVRPFPGSGARIQVSDNGGSEPLWGRSGLSLYYRAPNAEVVEVKVTTESEFSIGARTVVLTGDYLTDSSHPNYDVAPDGRFLMLKRAGAESQTVVVHNWGREVREKTAARK